MSDNSEYVGGINANTGLETGSRLGRDFDLEDYVDAEEDHRRSKNPVCTDFLAFSKLGNSMPWNPNR